MKGYRNRRSRCCWIGIFCASLGSLSAQQAPDWAAFNRDYKDTTDSLKKDQKLSSLILSHDQEVLQGAYTALAPQFKKPGVTSDDVAKAFTGAYFMLRSSKTLPADVGIRRMGGWGRFVQEARCSSKRAQ
jgi:hypothetical protein